MLSRLTTATNPSGTVTMAYDNRSRVSSVTDVFGQVVGYSYDANSNRTQLSLNSATSATYQYDVINRLTQLADSASLSTTFSYDVTDKLTSLTLPNGVVTTSQYDGLDRLTRLTHAKSGNTLADFQYQLNAVNNISQMIDDIGTHNYTYDTRDRLTAATHPSQTNETYAFDDVGNRTASHQGSSYSYQAFNQLTAANSDTYAYNVNGNLTSKTDANGSWSYSWDFENRLNQASKSGGVAVTYAYDALGRRIQQTSSTGGTTKFVYDGADVLRDLDGGGATIADYLNGPGIDNKIRQTLSGTVSYFATDHLGTTRGLTDASGNLTSTMNYDSFGNVTSGLAPTRYTYTGREIDQDTGLMYYRARWYLPREGRFVSEDPVGFKGGINLFAYVGNSVPNQIDPLGTLPGPIHSMSKEDREWWGYFLEDLFIKRQDCRPQGRWLSRFGDNFYETNVAVPGVTVPSLFPGLGLGLLTSGSTADLLGTRTALQYIGSLGAPYTSGAAPLTALETGVATAGGTLVNFAYVSIAYEAGVAVGSAINASFPRHCDCP